MAKRKETYYISGRFVRRESLESTLGLRVGVWYRDLIFKNLVGSSYSDFQ